MEGGGTVVLSHTVWPYHGSTGLHGFVKVDFVEGFGGDLCLAILWGFFEE